MNLIRAFNLCGGLLFGAELLLGIDAIAREKLSMLTATIISQSEKGGDAKSSIEFAANERGLINIFVIQTGVGAALACLREKRHE